MIIKQNVKDYLGIIEAAGGSVKAKQLAAQLIPKFFKYFPTLSVQAIDQHFNLCEDEELGVCLDYFIYTYFDVMLCVCVCLYMFVFCY